MKIGIFGGTFNPIHIAHLYIAEEVRQVLELKEVVFVPAGVPPHKEVQYGVSAEHRLKMVQLAVEGNPHFRISDFELTRPMPSYSIKTVEHMQATYGGDAELYFITGVDTFLDIGSWHAVDRLLTLCDFVTTFRPYTDQRLLTSSKFVHEVDVTVLDALDQKLRHVGKVELVSGRDLWLVATLGMDISSTEIRKRIKARKSAKYLLPEKVESYIIENRLYL
ncbi:MAG: nicotinate-nucleotide adenylyltransferase [Nitrospirota bacterium]